jgi:transcriptional regulator
MYVPAHFAVDEAAVNELLAQHGAADLVTVTDEGLVATMLPFAYVPDSGPHGAPGLGALHGHVARNNPQWKLPARGEALAIVRGPDAYISPTFYPSTAEHGRVVPTWNYLTAHVYGELIVHDDAEWTESVVRRLTDKHEASNDHPWSVDDAPRAFVEGQLRAIVGLELVISRVEAKAKLSQNRSVEDVAGVITGLRDRGDTPSAGLVARANAARLSLSAGCLAAGCLAGRAAGEFSLARDAHDLHGSGLAGHQLHLGRRLVQQHGIAAGHDRAGLRRRPGERGRPGTVDHIHNDFRGPASRTDLCGVAIRHAGRDRGDQQVGQDSLAQAREVAELDLQAQPGGGFQQVRHPRGIADDHVREACAELAHGGEGRARGRAATEDRDAATGRRAGLGQRVDDTLHVGVVAVPTVRAEHQGVRAAGPHRDRVGVVQERKHRPLEWHGQR